MTKKCQVFVFPTFKLGRPTQLGQTKLLILLNMPTFSLFFNINVCMYKKKYIREYGIENGGKLGKRGKYQFYTNNALL